MKKIISILTNWIIPLVISAVVFSFVQPVLAQSVQGPITLNDYILGGGSVEVGEDTVEGFRQVYYLYEGQKNFISNGNRNSRHPETNGKFVTYVTEINGVEQVFLYNLISVNTIQLTNSGNNQFPKVSLEGLVVWESWVDESQKWQVMLFDGKTVIQLTSGDLTINPFIEGDKIVYARRDITGEWRASLYSISAKSEKDVTYGNNTQYPKLRKGKIAFSPPGKAEEEFALTADDIFLLDLTTSGNQQDTNNVGINDILNELSTTSSAQINNATPSSETTPQSTNSGVLSN